MDGAASNGSTITKYTVTSSGGQTCTTPNGSATTCTVTGLTNGTAYTFTVTATNGLGTGPASTPSAPATPSTIPGAPTGVVATSFANAQSVVSWTAPASNGGAAITNYTVTSAPGGKTCTTSHDLLHRGRADQRHRLHLHGHCHQRLRHRPGLGSLRPGHSLLRRRARPTGVTGTANAANQSVVSWTAPTSNGGTPITSYTVTSSGGQTCTTPNGSTTTCTVTGLTNGTSYTFTVTATNAVGTGPASTPRPRCPGDHRRARPTGMSTATQRCERAVGRVLDGPDIERRHADHRLHRRPRRPVA